MNRPQRNGWRLGMALMSVVCLSQFVLAAEPAGDVQVAQAGMDASKITGGTFQEPPAGQNIEMTLAKPEQDVLSMAANEKLNADIGSLTFKDTDLGDVIRFIGRKLDLNFIFDSDVVQGKVTLTFRNVRVRDALDSILTSQKLAMVPDSSGIFRIVPQDRVGGQEIETRTDVIQLNWVAAEDVLKTMKPFLSKDGKMEINEASNVLIVTDVPPNLDNIKSLVKQVDQADRQVMIEARLVDVNVGALRELGTNLSVSKLGTATWQGGETIQTGVDSSGNAQAGLAALPYADTLGVVNNLLNGFSVKQGTGTVAMGKTVGIFGEHYNLQAVFTALENRNVVEILANPRVSTLNNVPANIDIVEKIPYISSNNLVSGAGSSNTIEFKDAGVHIDVKPIITPNGYVRLAIGLKQMIFRTRVGGGALDPPQIDERTANTNVIVNSGDTAVLGGLRQIRNSETINGVPWLHRIPLIGWLFKNKNYDQGRTELVLMVTPRIIEQTQKLTDHEKFLYNRIETKWHLPDRYMDDVKNYDEDNMPAPKF